VTFEFYLADVGHRTLESAKIAHFIEKFGIFESRKLLGNQNFSTFQQIQHAKMRQKALLIFIIKETITYLNK